MKNVRVKFYCLLGICILLVACDGASDNTGPGLKDAWIRAIPTGSGMTAGFGTLHNPGKETIRIQSFSSPSFRDVSLHRTELVDGLSKMREIPVLSIDAGSSVVLEPGGYHLMLMMPTEEIQPGDSVTIEMGAEDGRSFSFAIPVKRRHEPP